MANKILPYNPKLKLLARTLRNNSTASEIMLWQKIKRKALGVEFHRQVPIDNYIVDFYCHEIMLAIEIDGNSHDDIEVQKNDKYRQDRLECLGVNFIRFDDLMVKRNLAGVLLALQRKIEDLNAGDALPG